MFTSSSRIFSCMNAGKVASFLKLASLERILPKNRLVHWEGKTGCHHFLSQHLSSEKGVLTKIYTNQIDSKSIFRILVRCEAEKIRCGFRRGLARLSHVFFAISQDVSARYRNGKKQGIVPYYLLEAPLSTCNSLARDNTHSAKKVDRILQLQ